MVETWVHREYEGGVPSHHTLGLSNNFPSSQSNNNFYVGFFFFFLVKKFSNIYFLHNKLFIQAFSYFLKIKLLIKF